GVGLEPPSGSARGRSVVALGVLAVERVVGLLDPLLPRVTAPVALPAAGPAGPTRSAPASAMTAEGRAEQAQEQEQDEEEADEAEEPVADAPAPAISVAVADVRRGGGHRDAARGRDDLAGLDEPGGHAGVIRRDAEADGS